MKAGKVKRKTLVAREDLVDRLSEVAKQRGYSLYAIVNEVLELAVKAEETGIDLKRVVEEGSVLKAARDAGFILGLESLWNEMAELAYQKAKTQTLKSWYEAGIWLAKKYSTTEVEDPFATFKKDLEAFTWNAPEFTIEKAGEKVSVRIVSPRFTESYTALFTSFLEGALDAFGYKTTSKEISRGTIRLEAFKEEEADAPA